MFTQAQSVMAVMNIKYVLEVDYDEATMRAKGFILNDVNGGDCNGDNQNINVLGSDNCNSQRRDIVESSTVL